MQFVHNIFLILNNQWFTALAVLAIICYLVNEIIDKLKNTKQLFLIKFISVTAILYLILHPLMQFIFPSKQINLVEFSYDLRDHFPLEYNKIGLGQYSLERISHKEGVNNRYQICTPHYIEEMPYFVTSYDKNGIHHGRAVWLHGIDYNLNGKCIESRHQLNESFNDSQGRHMILYKYRDFFFNNIRLEKSMDSITIQNWLLFITILVALFGERFWRWKDGEKKEKIVTSLLRDGLSKFKNIIIRIRDERSNNGSKTNPKDQIAFSETSFSEIITQDFLFNNLFLSSNHELTFTKYPNTFKLFYNYQIQRETLRERKAIGTCYLTRETIDQLIDYLEKAISELI